MHDEYFKIRFWRVDRHRIQLHVFVQRRTVELFQIGLEWHEGLLPIAPCLQAVAAVIDQLGDERKLFALQIMRQTQQHAAPRIGPEAVDCVQLLQGVVELCDRYR